MTKVLRRVVLSGFGLVLALALSAGAGASGLDTDFGAGGIVRTAPARVRLGYTRTQATTDRRGRIYALGSDEEAFTVSRFLPGGRPDRGFGEDGIAKIPIVALAGNFGRATSDEGAVVAGAIAIEPDGKILVGGEYDTDLGSVGGGKILLARLSSGGSLDPGFGSPVTSGGVRGETVDGRFRTVTAIASEGRRILVAGEAGRGYVARFSPAGIFDPSFGGARGVLIPPPTASREKTASGVSALLVTDGAILAAGYADGGMLLARLSGEGRPVDRFGRGGLVVARLPERARCACGIAEGLARDRRGDVFLSGTVSIPRPGTLIKGGHPMAAIAKFLPGGGVARDFGTGGIAILRGRGTSFGHGLAIGPPGELTQAESFVPAGSGRPEFAVSRFRSNGSLDREFGTHGTLRLRLDARTGEAWSVTPAGPGIVVAGLERARRGGSRVVSTILAKVSPG